MKGKLQGACVFTLSRGGGVYIVMQSDGNSLKIDTFRVANYRFNQNSENFYLSVFVFSTSYKFFRTCINVLFLCYMLEKSVRFQPATI